MAPMPRKAVFMRVNISFRYLYRMITRARVEGMTCQHCVRAVFTALTAVDGITRADVSIGSLEVEHDGRVSLHQLREAVEVAGYRVLDGVVDRRTLPLL
jgi:copper chaperone CopZ